MSFITKYIIALIGNDGTGKSSIAQIINRDTKNNKESEFIALERSYPGFDDLKEQIKISQPDQLTLSYTFENRPETLVDKFTHQGCNYEVFWFLLDAEIRVLEQRIKDREKPDQWESAKALNYYRYRYRELAAYYGIPIIDTSKINKPEVVDRIMEMLQKPSFDYYYEVKYLALNPIDYEFLHENDIETILSNKTDLRNIDLERIPMEPNDMFTLDLFQSLPQPFQHRLKARWLLSVATIKFLPVPSNERANFSYADKILEISYQDLKFQIPWHNQMSYFRLRAEGESKKIYEVITDNPCLQGIVFIVLKSTIYSHSKQATGEIKNLGSVRAQGSKIFLEMMWRNGLKHSYRSINENGIILSDLIDPIPPTEIVVKKYCEGTDKYSYYQMLQNPGCVLSTGEYITGPYVRFDWRNPNHIDLRNNRQSVNRNIYYYLVEEAQGKEKFFENYLLDGGQGIPNQGIPNQGIPNQGNPHQGNPHHIQPFGDKNLSEELLFNIIDIPKTRENALKMFLTTQAYFSQVGLEIKDTCYMLDSTGTVFWSEINQDCMRIKTDDNLEQFDKDIWRAGGSSSKELLVKKWKAFNKLMINYFQENYFHQTELLTPTQYPYQMEVQRILRDPRLTLIPSYRKLYQDFIFTSQRRRVIVTMDLHNGQPVLVKSGKVCEVHSDGMIEKAFQKISIFPDILVVDLNGAFGDTQPKQTNRLVIKKLAKQYYIHSGGGLRTLADVQDVLESSARRIVVSSNLDSDFLQQIPKDRLIVELSVNENDEVLIHGRKTNTNIQIQDKLLELSKQGVEAISITFHQTEGHLQGLPRAQISRLMTYFPRGSIQKIIIAGGISTLDDLVFLWSFDRVIPQLGSAIWKDRLAIGDIYQHMIRFDQTGLVPTILQDSEGRNKGLVYLNRDALKLTCQTRKLYRWSRKHHRVMCKGETSGNYQRVIKISQDCDSDALLITTDSEAPFCHTGNYSCFSLQTVVKANLGTLKNHIQSRMNETSYSGQMQRNPHLALAKIMEEFWEIVTASEETQIDECSDLLVHLLMYLNGKGISLDSILNELNARRWNPKIWNPKLINNDGNNKLATRDPNTLVLAITPSKYTTKTDKFAETELGFRIIRPDGRSLKVNYEIVDPQKYQQYFGTKKLDLVTSRPKDMVWLMAFNRIDGVITYNTVVENHPKVYQTLYEIPDSDLRLALIKRTTEDINPKDWNKDQKALIATEHISHVHRFLHEENSLDENCFSLDRIIGSSEGYLVSTTRKRYLLCDAIVESGKTLEENDLEIWKVVLDRGQVKIGLYGNFILFKKK